MDMPANATSGIYQDVAFVPSKWFSSNPDKAWAEKFFLIYSPIWMSMMGIVMLTGLQKLVADSGFLAISLIVSIPLVLVPALLKPHVAHGLRWHQSYWFKANLYIFIFSFFGNYFGSEYFFDVVGMVYNYPSISWNFDSQLLGSGKQVVPLIMYFLTQAYFITYHTSATVVLRRIRSTGLKINIVIWGFLIFAVGYFWAWMETKAMANPLMRESFYYEKMDAMLMYGSMFYACYFIASFPVFYQIDEQAAKSWSVKDTIMYALAVSMIVFYLLDFWTKSIGTL
jgi:cycloeucalenol cycloisomerase